MTLNGEIEILLDPLPYLNFFVEIPNVGSWSAVFSVNIMENNASSILDWTDIWNMTIGPMNLFHFIYILFIRTRSRNVLLPSLLYIHFLITYSGFGFETKVKFDSIKVCVFLLRKWILEVFFLLVAIQWGG